MPTEPLTRVLRAGAPATLALLALGAGLGTALRGTAGAYGGVLGALLPAAFLGVTAGVGVYARKLRAELLGAAILGSWLIKMIVLIGFLAWLKHQDWFDRPVFFVTLLVGTFGLLMLEGWLVTRSPQYYTER